MQRFRYRLNDYIRAPEVRVIDESGQNLGVMPTVQAIELARQKELDLVEVSPLAQPPVAKIILYSKFKYEEEKQQRKERAQHKIVEVKIIRLSLRIGQHDREMRIKQAQRFLQEGNKVKIELNLKGRERQHKDLAREIIRRFAEGLQATTPIRIEQEIKTQGSQLSMLIAKK